MKAAPMIVTALLLFPGNLPTGSALAAGPAPSPCANVAQVPNAVINVPTPVTLTTVDSLHYESAATRPGGFLIEKQILDVAVAASDLPSAPGFLDSRVPVPSYRLCASLRIVTCVTSGDYCWEPGNFGGTWRVDQSLQPGEFVLDPLQQTDHLRASTSATTFALDFILGSPQPARDEVLEVHDDGSTTWAGVSGAAGTLAPADALGHVGLTQLNAPAQAWRLANTSVAPAV